MKQFLLSVLLLIGCNVFAQSDTSSIAKNGVYNTAADYQSKHLSFAYNNAREDGIKFKNPIGHYHQLWIKTKDSLYKFYDTDIWGYRQNGIDYRLYNGEMYEVNYVGNICIYYLPIVSSGSSGYFTCFSKDINSAVLELNKENLLEAYHSDPLFIEKLKQSKGGIYKMSKTKGRFLFIDWL
jgi:hypothetical protein